MSQTDVIQSNINDDLIRQQKNAIEDIDLKTHESGRDIESGLIANEVIQPEYELTEEDVAFQKMWGIDDPVGIAEDLRADYEADRGVIRPDEIDLFRVNNILENYVDDFSAISATAGDAVRKSVVSRALNRSIDSITDLDMNSYFDTDNYDKQIEKSYYLTQQAYGESDFSKWTAMVDDSDDKFDIAEELWLKSASPGESIAEDSLYKWYADKKRYDITEHSALLSVKALDEKQSEVYYNVMADMDFTRDDINAIYAMPVRKQLELFRAIGSNNPKRLDGGAGSVIGSYVGGVTGVATETWGGIERLGGTVAGEFAEDSDGEKLLKIEYMLNNITATQYMNDDGFGGLARDVAGVFGDITAQVGIGWATGGVSLFAINTLRYGASTADKLQFEFGMSPVKAGLYGIASGSAQALIEKAQLDLLGVKTKGMAKVATKLGKKTIAKSVAKTTAEVTRKSFMQSLAKKQLNGGYNKFFNTFVEASKTYIGRTGIEIGEESLQALVDAGAQYLAVYSDGEISEEKATRYMRGIGVELFEEIKGAITTMPFVTGASGAVDAKGHALNRNRVNSLVAEALASGDADNIAYTASVVRGLEFNAEDLRKSARRSGYVFEGDEDAVTPETAMEDGFIDPSELDMMMTKHISPANLDLFMKSHERSQMQYDLQNDSIDRIKVADTEFGDVWADSDGDIEAFVNNISKFEDVTIENARSVANILSYRDQIIRETTDNLNKEIVKAPVVEMSLTDVSGIVKQTFPNLDVAQDGDVITLTNPNGDTTSIRMVDEIEGEEGATGVFIDDIIMIANKGGDASTVLHENFHWIESTLLSKGDIKILEQAGLDSVDKRAEGFADYHLKGVVKVDVKEKSIWERVSNFFTNWRGRTVSDVFEKATETKKQILPQLRSAGKTDSFQNKTHESTATLHSISVELSEASKADNTLDMEAYVNEYIVKNELRISQPDVNGIISHSVKLIDAQALNPEKSIQELDIDDQVHNAISGIDVVTGLNPSGAVYDVIDSVRDRTLTARREVVRGRVAETTISSIGYKYDDRFKLIYEMQRDDEGNEISWGDFETYPTVVRDLLAFSKTDSSSIETDSLINDLKADIDKGLLVDNVNVRLGEIVDWVRMDIALSDAIKIDIKNVGLRRDLRENEDPISRYIVSIIDEGIESTVTDLTLKAQTGDYSNESEHVKILQKLYLLDLVTGGVKQRSQLMAEISQTEGTITTSNDSKFEAIAKKYEGDVGYINNILANVTTRGRRQGPLRSFYSQQLSLPHRLRRIAQLDIDNDKLSYMMERLADDELSAQVNHGAIDSRNRQLFHAKLEELYGGDAKEILEDLQSSEGNVDSVGVRLHEYAYRSQLFRADKKVLQSELDLADHDIALFEWMASELSDATDKANTIYSDLLGHTPFIGRGFFPVETTNAKEKFDSYGRGKSLIPKTLRHLKVNDDNFDVSGNIFKSFVNNLSQTNRYTLYGELQERMSSLLTNSKFREEIRRVLGDGFDTELNKHLKDVITNSYDVEYSPFLEGLMRTFSKMKLAYNLPVTLGQFTSFHLLYKNYGDGATDMIKKITKKQETGVELTQDEHYMMEDFNKTMEQDVFGDLTAIMDSSEMRKLYSDARTGKNSQILRDMVIEAEQEGLGGVKDNAFKRFFNFGMKTNSIGDKTPLMVFGSNVIKGFKKQALAMGMDSDVADKWATRELFKQYEKGQQSGVMSQLSSWQRGGSLKKIPTQFKSTGRQYLSAELSRWSGVYERALKEGGDSNIKIFGSMVKSFFMGSPEGRKLWRTLGMHRIISSVTWVGSKYVVKGLLGDLPEDDVMYRMMRDMFMAGLVGPWAGLYIAGGFLTDSLDGLVNVIADDKPVRYSTGSNIAPVSGFGTDVLNILRAMDSDIRKGDKNNDTLDALLNLTPVTRDVTKVFENFDLLETQKRRREKEGFIDKGN